MPVDFLTVRDYGQNEFGEIQIIEGRGWFGSQRADGSWHPHLGTHHISQSFSASTMSGQDAVDEVRNLFGRLVVSMDAAYGHVTSDADWQRVRRWADPKPPIRFPLIGLANIFWLNYFGKAMVARWPELATLEGSLKTANGGVIIETTADPWPVHPEDEGPFDADWKHPILNVIGAEPFTSVRIGGEIQYGVHVPTETDHVAATPGLLRQMPWEIHQERQDEAIRQRRYQRANQRRLALEVDRPEPPPPPRDAPSWSTSLDLPDWQDLYRLLRRRLRGDLTGTYGTTLAKEIATAPLDTEDTVTLNTVHGTTILSWFIGDYDVVDFNITGESAVAICQKYMKQEI